MRNLASAVALAMLCACAGYTSGPNQTPTTPILGGQADGGVIADAGDAGIDGGPDAGCAPLTLNTVAAIDGCLGGPAVTGTADVNVAAADAGNACAVTISLTTGSGPCSGVASSGALDAFDGGCLGTGLTCTSPSLPGTLTCTGGCTIRICDAGVCSP
jgi:hypothetical protein